MTTIQLLLVALYFLVAVWVDEESDSIDPLLSLIFPVGAFMGFTALLITYHKRQSTTGADIP